MRPRILTGHCPFGRQFPRDYAPNNAGVTFYLDILMPVMLIALLVYYLRVNSQEEEHERIHSGGPMGQVG